MEKVGEAVPRLKEDKAQSVFDYVQLHKNDAPVEVEAPRRALRRGTRSHSYQYQERLRKAAEADAAARRAGRSAVFREGDIANHRDGDSDDDTDDERETALRDHGVFLEPEGGSDSDGDASSSPPRRRKRRRFAPSSAQKSRERDRRAKEAQERREQREEAFRKRLLRQQRTADEALRIAAQGPAAQRARRDRRAAYEAARQADGNIRARTAARRARAAVRARRQLHSRVFKARMAPLDELTDAMLSDRSAIGAMDQVCPHCLARLWKGELTKSGLSPWGKCCQHGQLNGSIREGLSGNIPIPPAPPPFLASLLTNLTTAESKCYLRHARNFNNAFSMASYICHHQILPGPLSDFRIQGAAYHGMGAIRGPSAAESKFMQVFFTCADEAAGLAAAGSRSHVPKAAVAKSVLQQLRDELQGPPAAAGAAAAAAAGARAGARVTRMAAAAAATTGGCNPLFLAFRAADMLLNQPDAPPPADLRLVFQSSSRVRPVDPHARQYNLPETGCKVSNSELAVVIDSEKNCEGGWNADLAVRPTTNTAHPTHLTRIASMHKLADPLTGPCLFPHGTPGYGWQLYKKIRPGSAKYVTAHELTRFRLFHRDAADAPVRYDTHLLQGRLSQQLIVQNYTKIEKERLSYLRNNQKRLKAAEYKEVRALVAAGRMQDAGRHVVLPSTFTGGPRNMIKKFADAMAAVRKMGKPDLFLTMTCNPGWPEIQAAVPAGRKAYEFPWLCARVFNQKLEELKEDLFKKNVLGRAIAHVYVIEFQKRGLPHAHMLITLKEEDKPKCADQYDSLICAEITEGTSPMHVELRKLQLKHMIHGHKDKCFAEDDVDHKDCQNHYPREFAEETMD